MRPISVGVLCVTVLGAQLANAQVYKCTEADGKTVYSQAPCVKADNKEKVVKLMDAPLTDSAPSSRSGDLESAANYGRNYAAPETQTRSNNQTQARPLNRMRTATGTSTASGPSNQQLIAECEANHGARCSSTAEINYRRQEKRAPSAQEQADIQTAIRARREREEAQRERAFFRR
ncbi:MAG: DUF4124 domain-containing protein [Pseudomonadota bacterium]